MHAVAKTGCRSWRHRNSLKITISILKRASFKNINLGKRKEVNRGESFDFFSLFWLTPFKERKLILFLGFLEISFFNFFLPQSLNHKLGNFSLSFALTIIIGSGEKQAIHRPSHPAVKKATLFLKVEVSGRKHFFNQSLGG